MVGQSWKDQKVAKKANNRTKVPSRRFTDVSIENDSVDTLAQIHRCLKIVVCVLVLVPFQECLPLFIIPSVAFDTLVHYHLVNFTASQCIICHFVSRTVLRGSNVNWFGFLVRSMFFGPNGKGVFMW